jgi:hypothetical protein
MTVVSIPVLLSLALPFGGINEHIRRLRECWPREERNDYQRDQQLSFDEYGPRLYYF